jgi:hypothetical protein
MDRPSHQNVRRRRRNSAGRGVRRTGHRTPSASSQRAGNFKIDKIHHRQSATLNSEYIVVKNTSAKKRKLTHFRIVDPNDGQRYTFPSTSLKPGHTVTLHTGHGRNRPGHRYWNQDAPVGNNDGDTA